VDLVDRQAVSNLKALRQGRDTSNGGICLYPGSLDAAVPVHRDELNHPLSKQECGGSMAKVRGNAAEIKYRRRLGAELV
jgi:hypothetical protein